MSNFLNKAIRYLDLRNNYVLTKASMVADSDDHKNLSWWPQYIALFTGVIVQPFLQNYLSNGTWDLTGIMGWIIASVFISIMALPAVYKNAFDQNKPLIVQLCVLFTSGMGWQSVVTIVKHVTKQ